MCNLCGVVGDINQKELDVMETLLILGQLRGRDSTGVSAVLRGKPPRIKTMKRVMNAMDFLWQRKIYDVLSTQAYALIGHNRSATIGEVSQENAHPFQFGHNFVGAHNGTVTNKYAFKDYEAETDSETILNAIYQEGAEKILPKVMGAYTLVWYDATDLTINFSRNEERPLFYAYDKAKEHLFWASEAMMLHLALTRSSVDYDGKVYSANPNVLYKIKIPFGKAKIDLDKDVTQTKIVKALSPSPIHQHNHHANNHHHHGGRRQFPMSYDASNLDAEDWGVEFAKAMEHVGTPPVDCAIPSTKALTTVPIVKNNVIPIVDPNGEPLVFYRGYNGVKLTTETYAEATKNGCAWCKTSVTYPDTVRFLAAKIFLCSDCMKNDEIQATFRP